MSLVECLLQEIITLHTENERLRQSIIVAAQSCDRPSCEFKKLVMTFDDAAVQRIGDQVESMSRERSA